MSGGFRGAPEMVVWDSGRTFRRKRTPDGKLLLHTAITWLPEAKARPHLVLLHQACREVPHRPCIMHHNEARLPAELVVA